MPHSIALLHTNDPVLVRGVQQSLAAIADLKVETVCGEKELGERIPSRDVALVLFHLPADAPADALGKFLTPSNNGGRAIASVVLSDRHRPEEELEALRLGAADFLERPLDWNRLAYVADVLTVRARYAARASAATKPHVVRLGDQDPFLYVPSDAAQAWMERVRRVAPGDSTV